MPNQDRPTDGAEPVAANSAPDTPLPRADPPPGENPSNALTHAAPSSGLALLLELLGGMLIAGVVACGGAFAKTLIEPYTIGRLGTRIEPPGEAVLLAHLVYFGYLFNVFRQIHGLAIVVDDPDHHDQLGRFMRLSTRVATLCGLIAVLAFPALLLSIVTGTPDDPLHKALSVIHPQLAMPSPTHVLAALALTSLSYVIWDCLSWRSLPTESRTAVKGQRGFGWICWSAIDYPAFLWNWMILAGYLLLASVLLPTLLSVSLSVGSFHLLSPTWKPETCVLVLLVFTYGYTLIDYVVNREFYFREMPFSHSATLIRPVEA